METENTPKEIDEETKKKNDELKKQLEQALKKVKGEEIPVEEDLW